MQDEPKRAHRPDPKHLPGGKGSKPSAPGTVPSPSRRGFMQTTIAALTSAATCVAGELPAKTNRSNAMPVPAIAPPRPVRLRINGKDYDLLLEPRVTLLDALRETIGLTGTKKGCDRGQCGACTVLADGRRINACLSLAVMQEGREITTVEGLARDNTLHPLQAAFIEYDAFQCGYCTPGQLCSASAMLSEWRAGSASAATHDIRKGPGGLSDEEIKERMSGNLCRCGAYPNIVAAIKAVSAGSET